jgi:hypothetical protein
VVSLPLEPRQRARAALRPIHLNLERIITMPRFLATARRLLCAQLGRLNHHLLHLGQRLRERIAGAVGRTVCEIAREAVHAALAELAGSPLPSSAIPPLSPRRPPFWDELDDDQQRNLGTEPNEFDDPLTPEARDDWLSRNQSRSGSGAGEKSPATAASASPWMRALAAACQAAAWWLRRHPQRRPLLSTLAVGLAAGVVAYSVSPLLAAGATVVASAVSLLLVADAATSAVQALTGLTSG